MEKRKSVTGLVLTKDIEYINDYIKLTFEMKCGSKHNQYILDSLVKSESGMIPANKWENEDTIGCAFPIIMNSVCLTKIQIGKNELKLNSEKMVLDHENVYLQEDDLKISLNFTEKYNVPYGISVVTPSNSAYIISGELLLESKDEMIQVGLNFKNQWMVNKMSLTIDLYATLNKSIYDKIGYFEMDYDFYYHNNGYKIPLDSKTESYGSSNSQYITDQNCQWYAGKYDFCFERKIRIDNTKFLFGPSGIAEEGSTLGVALMWYSKSSNQRGIFDIGEIEYRNQGAEFLFEGRFEKGKLKGTIILQTVLYMKKPSKNDKRFATSSGAVLGVLDEYAIVLDGKGSVFPIVEIYDKTQPLWYVKCFWEDPLIDKFDDDHVCIYLNKANVAFPLLKLEDGLKGSPFLVEVISGAMQTIIQKVCQSEYWDDIRKEENIGEGSIAQAINYFITNFGWDVSSPERLASSIRIDLDKRLM